MKQIWIDYCKEMGLSLDKFVVLFQLGKRFKISKKKEILYNYISWLEDQNKEMTGRLEVLENLNEEED